MKKILLLILALTLLVSLAACGDQPATPTTTEDNAPVVENTTEDNVQTPPEEKGYTFVLENVELIPGAAFDTSVLPEAGSVYEVPSCAIEGTDKVYNYGVVEVTAFDDGTGPVIYSIYLLDIDTTTTEGLYLGDDLAQVESLYGTDYTENGTELIFTKGSSELRLLMEDGCVVSIEYRMVTE